MNRSAAPPRTAAITPSDDADDGAEQGAEQGEGSRHGQALGDVGPDRASVDQRDSEVALQHLAEPVDVLDDPGVVPADRLVVGDDLLGRRRLPERHATGCRTGQVDEHEGDPGGDQQRSGSRRRPA